MTAALVHANIVEGGNVYLDVPKVFEHYLKIGPKKCLKLKKTLCGLHRSPREFWQ